jgi:hypothetical protein
MACCRTFSRSALLLTIASCATAFAQADAPRKPAYADRDGPTPATRPASRPAMSPSPARPQRTSPEIPPRFRPPRNMEDQDMGGMMGRPGRERPGGEPARANPPEPLLDAPGVSPGQPAPDVTLKRLDGTNFAPAAFRGKLLLIEFGSYSCPSFRQHAAAMEQLKADYAGNSDLALLIVYTKEAHPAGAWEVARNREQRIAVEQPADQAARAALAKKAQAALRLTIPLALDSMDDAAAAAFGGFPNGAVLVGRDGRVIARQQWTDPTGLHRLIDRAKAGAPDHPQ